MFTPEDLKQIEQHGLSVESVERQLENFRKGFPYLKIIRSARVGDGIVSISQEQSDALRAEYRDAQRRLKIEKFVPASGAATRMFKDLFSFVESGERNSVVDKLSANIDRFAFSEALSEKIALDAPLREVVKTIVGEGLEYGSKPKGLLLFHKYPTGARTPFEEHLAEGAMYASSDGAVNIHFTVSPEHVDGFSSLFESVRERYEKRYEVKYNISFSVQKGSTDTIAVNEDCTPFREADGSLLFRPAGHGALIENLNDIDADLIFIKTIDNVAPDHLKADTIKYKEVLAGLLVSVQNRIFSYAQQLEEGSADLMEVAAFVERELCVLLPDPDFTQTRIHCVRDAIQPSHPLSSP